VRHVGCWAGDGHTQGVAHAQDPKPSQQEAPRSVVYGRLLLSIQACRWAVIVLPAAAIVALNIRANVDHHTAGHAAVFIGLSIVALLFLLGMSAASAYLAANLKPRRTSIRRGAIAVEAFMTCFGLLSAYVEASTGAGIIAGLPVTAGLIGTMLSLTAVVALLSKAARSFTRSVNTA
jgi:peptidoglycan/LPS O-acetylase OafA/YrhL